MRRCVFVLGIQTGPNFEPIIDPVNLPRTRKIPGGITEQHFPRRLSSS